MTADYPVVTLQDLMDMKKLEGLRLIAGKAGLNHPVDGCGILDYEFDPGLNNRFRYANYRNNLFVLSSLAYAKDDHYLVNDAVRTLIELGTSCIAIRNVYHIKIQDSVLRYADSKAYPIFLIEDDEAYFEKIIRSVYDVIALKRSRVRYRGIIDDILHVPLGREAEGQRAYSLFPSAGRYYAAFFFRLLEPLPGGVWALAEQALGERLDAPYVLVPYLGHFILLHTVTSLDVGTVDAESAPAIETLTRILPPCAVGVSRPHRGLEDMRSAITESIHASLPMRESGVSRYDELGVYQILLPRVSDPMLRDYSERILNPVAVFDAESNGRLMMTLSELVRCNRDIRALSAAIGQHENTVRQRLARIEAITGLDYRSAADYEQLSIAVRIRDALNWSDELGL